MKKIAISIGDLNGIGLEIALKSHKEISKICKPIYVANKKMLSWGAALLGVELPDCFKIKHIEGEFEIEPGKVCKKSGEFSYESFLKAIKMAKKDKVDGIVTLPISKEAWSKSGIEFNGHTDVLDDLYDEQAIMMIGNEDLKALFYTHHIPLRSVAEEVTSKKLTKFLLNVSKNVKSEKIGVLALNPHAGDGGVIGEEEEEIKKAIKKVNKSLGEDKFEGPIVPDVAFNPIVRKKYNYYVTMYHDQALPAIKAIYFEDSINVTLNLPITRASVDHGVAYDIAYKDSNPSCLSYINAIKYIVNKEVK